MGQDHSGDSGAKRVDARVARRRQDQIGRRLRQMYEDVVSEPLPSDFLSILEDADGKKPSVADAQEKTTTETGEKTEPGDSAPNARIMKSKS